MALLLGTRVNKNLQAIQAIKAQRAFDHEPNPLVVRELRIICNCIEDGFRLGDFPDADADFTVVGKWITDKLHALATVWPQTEPSELVLQAARVPTSEEFRQVLGTTTAVPTIMVSAVTKFMESATRYEAQRIASARKQLQNDDVDPETINKLIADKAALRNFIQTRRQQLIAQLSEIQAKIRAQDPFNLPTEKELALYERHKAWFEGGNDFSAEYLPNDNAVPYALMAAEVMEVITKHKIRDGGNLWVAYHSFCEIVMRAINNESASRAYRTLQSTPSINIERYDVGAAIRDYVSDADRNRKAARSAADPKLQTATQRGVRRLERLCAISVPCNSPFTIYNLPLEEVAAQVVLLSQREQEAKALLNRSSMNRGVEALSDAESILWNVCTGRHKLLVPNTGRNDLSVPIIVASITTMTSTGLPRQPARNWSIKVNIPPMGRPPRDLLAELGLSGFRSPRPAPGDSKATEPPTEEPPLFESPQEEMSFRASVVFMDQETIAALPARRRSFAERLRKVTAEIEDDDT